MGKTKDAPLLEGAEPEIAKEDLPPAPPVRRARNELTRMEPHGVPAPAVPSDPFLAMIREVALRPDLDTSKLQALLDMQERVEDRKNRLAFDKALARMQPKLPVVDRNGRIEIRAKDSKTNERTGAVQQSTAYAKHEDIVQAVTPILGRYGFGVRYKTGLTEDGRVRVVTILSGHGHREEAEFILPHDPSGSKNAVQAIGSSTAYGKRMGLCAILNIVSRGQDDDGFAAGPPVVVGEVITAEELGQLVDQCEAVGAPRAKFIEHLDAMRPRIHPHLTKLEDLPRARFQEAVDALAAYDAKRREVEANKRAEADKRGASK